jgi:hypothetical protein
VVRLLARQLDRPAGDAQRVPQVVRDHVREPLELVVDLLELSPVLPALGDLPGEAGGPRVLPVLVDRDAPDPGPAIELRRRVHPDLDLRRLAGLGLLHRRDGGGPVVGMDAVQEVGRVLDERRPGTPPQVTVVVRDEQQFLPVGGHRPEDGRGLAGQLPENLRRLDVPFVHSALRDSTVGLHFTLFIPVRQRLETIRSRTENSVWWRRRRASATPQPLCPSPGNGGA